MKTGEFLLGLDPKQIDSLGKILREDQKKQFDALMKVLSQEAFSHTFDVDGITIEKGSLITRSSEGYLTIEGKEVSAKYIDYYGDNIYIYSIDGRFILAYQTVEGSIEHVFSSSVTNVQKPKYKFRAKDLVVEYADNSIKEFLLYGWKHGRRGFLVPK